MTDTLRAALAEHGFTLHHSIPERRNPKACAPIAPEGPAASPLRQPGHPAIKELQRRWRVRLGLEG